MEEVLTCPISGEIFFDPVMASDGCTYERSMILRWFERSRISPLTGKPIDNKLANNRIVRQMVDVFLQYNPDSKQDVFEPESDHYVDFIADRLFKHDFKALLPFRIKSKFLATVKIRNVPILAYLFSNCKEQILTQIIEKLEDLEYETHNGGRIIHYACRYSMVEVVKHVVKKGVNLECQDAKLNRPIHYACCFATLDVVQYLVEQGVNLQCSNSQGERPIDFARKFNSADVARYLESIVKA